MQTFTSFDEALRASDKWTQRLVLINGIPTDCTDVTTRHGRSTPVAACTLMLEAPLPSHVRVPATVEVQAGYPGQVATIFSGYIPNHESVVNASGAWASVQARGWADMLTDPPLQKLSWPGPVRLKEIVRSIIAHCKVPYSLVDDMTYDDGSPILLGINPHVENRAIEISNTTGLLSWLTQTLALFGYAIFDTPSGVVRVQRISGAPVGDVAISVTEDEIGYEYRRQVTTDGMVTYAVARGVRYTDPDGVQQTIRSIPASVTLTPLLQPRGVRKGERSSDVLVTAAMADAARNVMERDLSALIRPRSWKTDLAPHVQPGDVATVTSPTVGASGSVWITSVAHSLSAGSMKTTTCEGIRGAGAPLPAGQDCTTLTLRSSPVHLGDERISWYAVPSPVSRTVTFDFSVPDDYTSLKITALAHGCNSYLLGGGNTESTVSKFILTQGGKEISSGALQALPENFNQQLPYGSSDKYWTRIVVPMSGSLKTGIASFTIASGEDKRLPASTRFDDFEVKSVVLTACGVGEPLFVSGGVS